MTTTKKRIKLLIVDDHPVVRQGLSALLGKNPDVQLVGEAADGQQALSKIRELSPDVVLMDISMPQMDGLEVTELLRKEAPNVKVIILSMHTNRDYILRIIQAGARGYILKDAPPEEFLRAIQAVSDGETFFSPDVARIALNQYVSSGGKPSPFSQLSEREREVLAMIAEGRSNKEIAAQLGIGVRTAETHRERIMRKLNIRTVAGLTKFAIVNGISSLDDVQNPKAP